MDCSLWLNRKKISSAAQIPDNLDVASLRGYFLAGSLIEWLEEHDGKKYAAKLAKLSPDDPYLNGKISRIFGGTPLPAKLLDGAPRECAPSGAGNGSLCLTSSFFAGVAGSFRMPNSFRFTNSSFSAFGGSGVTSFTEFSSFLAYLLGSFGGSFTAAGSFTTSFSRWEHEWERLWEFFRSYSGGSFVSSSFLGSSFSQWEWLWEFFRSYSGGSFVSSSFLGSSFSQWEWLWEFFWSYSGGSFVSASFFGASFSQWEWLWEFLRSYSGGSFVSASFFGSSFAGWESFYGMFGSFKGGSFPGASSPFSEGMPFALDEYDFIMFKTLMLCPLDRFGYGIHII